MTTYVVTVDVTMSGDIYIDAENEQQAKQYAQQKYFVASDLTNFHQISTEVYEVEQEQ